MTQEDKELLLKDLCARLPYHTIVSTGKEDLELVKVDILNGLIYVFSESFLEFDVFEIKPYLRPMSSMTEEEREELSHYENPVQRTDFYYSHHIDCRFMIEKGLALEAPKNMYNLKEK